MKKKKSKDFTIDKGHDRPIYKEPKKKELKKRKNEMMRPLKIHVIGSVVYLLKGIFP